MKFKVGNVVKFKNDPYELYNFFIIYGRFIIYGECDKIISSHYLVGSIQATQKRINLYKKKSI